MTFNVETATLQEVVDYSVQMIVKQGNQCLGQHGDCVYGNEYGQHCAVGWLLDEDNEKLMAAQGTVTGLVLMEGKEGYVIPDIVKVNKDVLNILQSFHDATLHSIRIEILEKLRKAGINISGVWFQEWIAMANT